ncbi:MAG: DUF3551 domain-containing protein [Tardiphaga sp.]|nr:DUF3551 domain-containing protein [Tardiphaga sp.]
MLKALFALIALGTVAAVDCSPAAASPSGYPFCMRSLYGDDDCSYSTYRQCAITASGQGTTCFQNPALAHSPAYTEQPAPRSRSRQRRGY